MKSSRDAGSGYTIASLTFTTPNTSIQTHSGRQIVSKSTAWNCLPSSNSTRLTRTTTTASGRSVLQYRCARPTAAIVPKKEHTYSGRPNYHLPYPSQTGNRPRSVSHAMPQKQIRARPSALPGSCRLMFSGRG
jgi:hypothetical protein